jgi:hypothetical protein
MEGSSEVATKIARASQLGLKHVGPNPAWGLRLARESKQVLDLHDAVGTGNTDLSVVTEIFSRRAATHAKWMGPSSLTGRQFEINLTNHDKDNSPENLTNIALNYWFLPCF